MAFRLSAPSAAAEPCSSAANRMAPAAALTCQPQPRPLGGLAHNCRRSLTGFSARPLRHAPAAAGSARERQDAAAAQLEQTSPGAATDATSSSPLTNLLFSTAGLWLLSELPALAEEAPSPAYSQGSYVVSLGLFLVSLPGLWSLIKRAPKAKKKRRTFEVAGPAVSDSMPLDARARSIFTYFKKYNYTVRGTGDVITFVGNYQASVSQAAALTLYTLVSLASTALVLSIAVPAVGNYWYCMCLISPAAGYYYIQNGNREEEFKVKMVTSDDEKTTDIVVEGDEEEIERMRRELDLYEKGKVYVKGILEELNQA